MDLTCSLENPGVMRRESLSWVLPDAALLFGILTIFICLFLFDGTQKLFRDSDTGWHIRTGEAILSGSGLPQTDPYSLLRRGQPWFAWEWGADVLMGAAHRLDGMTGVALLYGLAIGACSWFWFQLHWAVGGNFLIAGAMATLMISTANLHWLARPHVFGWLFLLASVWYAEGMKSRSTGHALLAGAVLGAVWANVHASFFLAPLIALIYAFSHFLRPLIWQLDRAAEWSLGRRFAITAAAAFAGGFLNPYGWHLQRHVIAYLGNNELLDRIGEFQSFNFHAEGSLQILLCVGLAAFGAVLALGQRNLAHFLLAAAFLGIALRSARGLPLVALLLLPLANGAISKGLAEVKGLQPHLQQAIANFLQYSRNLRSIDAGLRGYAVAPVAVVLVFAALHAPAIQARTGFPDTEFPVEASAKLPVNIRLLAPDKFGGYLIYRFNGALPVFFDGRSDFYGSAYMKDYLNLVEVRPGWRELLDRDRFTHALLPNRYSLIPALRQLGWKQTYTDGTATLLEKQ
ncbi:MAG: hypothetical protein ABJF23_07115 [Bryobacteraceae bacterium]